jgi:hypothetical protein
LSIYDQLVKAHAHWLAPRRADEDDQEYLTRLTQAVSQTTKDEFDDMSETAQLWFDAAADALNEGRVLPLPPGYRARSVPIQSIAVRCSPRPPATPAQQRVAIKTTS